RSCSRGGSSPEFTKHTWLSGPHKHLKRFIYFLRIPRLYQSCVYLDIFVAVVTSAVDLGNLLPGTERPYNIARIQDVAFYCVNNSAYDFVGFHGNPALNDDSDPAYTPKETYGTNNGLVHPCASLKKLVSTG